MSHRNDSDCGNDNEYPISGFIFLTYGDVSSAAYNRARLLGSELAAQGFRIKFLADKTASNISNASWLAGGSTEVQLVRYKPHIIGVLHRRIHLRKSKPQNLLIVQLNPHLKAFLSLVGLQSKIVCEWDEPPIFRKGSKVQRCLNKFLHNWFLSRAEFKISCTQYFQLLNPGFAYVPHGYYLPISDRTPSIGNYAAYMGNLQQPWDHDLIFTGALSLARQGIRPEIHIIGSGAELSYWKQFCKEHTLSNVHFMGRLSDCRMQIELENAKVLLHPMRDTMLNRTRCSSKLLAYAQSGRPVIGHLVGEAEALLGSFLVGVHADDSIMDRLATYLSQDLPDFPSKILDHTYRERANQFIRAISNQFLT